LPDQANEPSEVDQQRAVDNPNDNMTSLATLLHVKNPTDRGYFPEDIADDDPDGIKRFVVEHGSCRPLGPFPRNIMLGRQYKHSFSESYYNMKTQAGIQIPVTWLCYSPLLDAAYCEPCWLFANRADPGYRAAWSSGIRDWRDLSRKIAEHSTCSIHVVACMTYDQWKRHETIDKKLASEIRRERNTWRQVLTRVFKVTLSLVANSQSFRGHREKIGEVYNGNFSSQVELLAAFDPVMADLLTKPMNTIKYLSPLIQNEMIEVLAKQLERIIVDEINSAPFFSIITDTTQDVSKVDQLSQVFRYAKVAVNENKCSSAIEICESFLGILCQYRPKCSWNFTSDCGNSGK